MAFAALGAVYRKVIDFIITKCIGSWVDLKLEF